jgi:5-enolpyruvylshikimate-3-phosphate synthase
LSLAFVAIRALRGRPSAPVRPAEPLLDQLARLDAQYRGREGELPADEWSRYQAERQRLKEELSGQLAGKRPPT